MRVRGGEQHGHAAARSCPRLNAVDGMDATCSLPAGHQARTLILWAHLHDCLGHRITHAQCCQRLQKVTVQLWPPRHAGLLLLRRTRLTGCCRAGLDASHFSCCASRHVPSTALARCTRLQTACTALRLDVPVAGLPGCTDPLLALRRHGARAARLRTRFHPPVRHPMCGPRLRAPHLAGCVPMVALDPGILDWNTSLLQSCGCGARDTRRR